MRLAKCESLNLEDLPRFPLHGKHPAISKKQGGNGFYDATTDPATIARWERKYRNCNWGIRTGVESGIIVLDVDLPDGPATLRAWEQRHGDLPATFTVRTGSGGLHRYYRHPGGCVVSVHNDGVLGKDLHLKADGGYVVAPGGIHPDTHKPYEIVADVPVADAPAWLLALLRDNGKVKSKTVAGNGSSILEGERDNTLISIAGSLRRQGQSQEQIEAALHEVNQTRCKPPMEMRDVKRIAKSAATNYPPCPTGGNGNHPAPAYTFTRCPKFPCPAKEYGLDSSALGVLFALCTFEGNGRCDPSVKKTAERAGCCEKTASTKLKELRAAGLVSWENRKTPDGDPDSNEYTIHFERYGNPYPTTQEKKALEVG